MTLILFVLLSLLDSDHFATREAATRALTALASHCWQHLYAVEGWPLEVQLRCRVVADKHWPKIPLKERQEYVAGLRPAGWRNLPWYVWKTGGGKYLHTGHGAANCWESYRVATACWLEEAAATMTPPAIRVELERMAAAELEWIAANPVGYRTAGGPRRHH